MQLYAITSGGSFAVDEGPQTAQLLAAVEGWARGGVDFIQVREKDLGPLALEQLVRRVVQVVSGSGTISEERPRVLVNGEPPLSTAVALTSGADGVHLPGKLSREAVEAVRRDFKSAVVSVACHSVNDVVLAAACGADLALLAPVFGKPLDSGPDLPGGGLETLASACATSAGMPVFALGGVTAQNAHSCIVAGAAGIAGIRLFASSEWRRLVRNAESVAATNPGTSRGASQG